MLPLPVFASCGATGPKAWTPKILSPSFWLLAPVAGSQEGLTIVSGRVSAVADAAGGAAVLSQGTAGNRPLWNNTDVLDGRTTIEFAYSRHDRLYSATGGHTGTGEHTLISLCRLKTVPPNAVGGAIMQYGAPTATSGANSVLGHFTVSAQTYWGGGAGYGSPVGPAGVVRTDTVLAQDPGITALDLGWHLLEKHFAGGTVDMRLDGVPITLLNTDAAAIDVASAQFGIGEWSTTDGFQVPDHETPFGIWLPRGLASDERSDLNAYIRRTFPETFPDAIGGVGDSKMYGAYLSATEHPLALTCSDLARKEINGGVSGDTIAQCTTRVAGFLAKQGVFKCKAVIVDVVVNDLIAHTSATANDLIDQINADVIAPIRAAIPGVKIVQRTCTPSDLVTGADETKRVAFNSALPGRSAADAISNVAAVSGLSTTNPTNYQDHTHWNATGAIKVSTEDQAALATVGVP